MDHQPGTFDQGRPPAPQPKKGLAIASLVLGILAMTIPVPILDIIFGVIGIVLGRIAQKSGVGGLATGGFVVSIIGTVVATGYTILVMGLLAIM